MRYITFPYNKGFIVVDEDSSDTPTADKPNRVTPNLNETEFQINLLKVKDCPINGSCVSLVLVAENEVTYFCKYYQMAVVPYEGHSDKSHAHVVCAYKKT